MEGRAMTLRTRQGTKCSNNNDLSKSSTRNSNNLPGDKDSLCSSEISFRTQKYLTRQKRGNVSEKDIKSHCDSIKKSKRENDETTASAANSALSRPLKHETFHARKIMQPLNGSKRIVCKTRKSQSLANMHEQMSGDNSTSSPMLHHLPSKIAMFAQAPKSLIESKFGLSFGRPAKPVPQRLENNNLLQLLNQNEFGLRGGVRGKKILLRSLSNEISEFHLVHTSSPFDRRCTAMTWHPFNHNLVAVGSKGGDIILLDLENSNRDVFIQGCGLGGVIQAMKFIPKSSSSLGLLTASMDGTVILRDLATQAVVTTFVDTSDLIHQFWYCSCDVGPQSNMVVHGDSLGNAVLLTLNGEKIWSHKLHRNKVNHVEFHRKHEWLLSTASTDQRVCLWDIRMLKDRDSYIAQLKHEKGVNSACFNNTDGTRLLTTDQHHELRVYECGTWSLEQTIVHPHRFYQHLTPMKASWHPLEDLIICGRYPDKALPGFATDLGRGIDFIDPFSAKVTCHLYDPLADGIVSLAQFNSTGSTLAATMGYTILIWKRNITSEKENYSQKTEQPYSLKPSDDIVTPSSNSLPVTRSKKKLPKGSKDTKKH